jgi:hypothetical protein
MNRIPDSALQTVYWIDKQMKDATTKESSGEGMTKSIHRKGRKRSLLNLFRKAGWKQSALDTRFQMLSDDMLSQNDIHESTVRGFGTLWYEEQGFDTSIAKTLVNLGFSASVAKNADYAISPLQHTCYTNAQLIQIAIQHAMGYFKPMTAPDTTYFYSPNQTEEWIPYRNITIMNIRESCSTSLVPKLEPFLKPILKQGMQWFFHTTSWEDSLRILTQVDHAKGNTCLDFGITPSFYLSDKLVHALKWGEHLQKRGGNEVATVLFAIPTTLPSHLRYKEIKGATWRSAVVKSRQCVPLRPHETNIPEIAPYDLVFGDMLANPQQVMENKQPRTHDPPKKQLASKSYEADRFLQGCIVGIFVYNKQIP